MRGSGSSMWLSSCYEVSTCDLRKNKWKKKTLKVSSLAAHFIMVCDLKVLKEARSALCFKRWGQRLLKCHTAMTVQIHTIYVAVMWLLSVGMYLHCKRSRCNMYPYCLLVLLSNFYFTQCKISGKTVPIYVFLDHFSYLWVLLTLKRRAMVFILRASVYVWGLFQLLMAKSLCTPNHQWTSHFRFILLFALIISNVFEGFCLDFGAWMWEFLFIHSKESLVRRGIDVRRGGLWCSQHFCSSQRCSVRLRFCFVHRHAETE